ncbi:unnamed protein product, partial [Rotaria socialis]
MTSNGYDTAQAAMPVKAPPTKLICIGMSASLPVGEKYKTKNCHAG